MIRLRDTQIHKHGASRQLVLILHGFNRAQRRMVDVTEAVAEEMPDADILAPSYPTGLFSNAGPIAITEALLDAVDHAVEQRLERGGEYEEILLMGHSLGSLLVRKLYVFARGQNQDSSYGIQLRPRDWALKVSRILLLAGMNRGWSLSPRPRHMPFGTWLAARLLRFGARAVGLARQILAIERGAPFLANLRIQWLNLANGPEPPPLTVQVLGTVDELVSSQDHVDLQSGSNFVYRHFPETGHAEVVSFRDGKIGKQRRKIFNKVLTKPVEELPSDFLERIEPDPEVETVLFVMHGIRDRGFWTDDIAHRAQDVAQEAEQKIRVVISGYGYFPMLPFLFFGRRQRNVRWFMDQYTEALARYPKAKMAFIGHSNGTYLLASALKRYAACTFDHVVFAGSVVPTRFPWKDLIRKRRVAGVRNYVATADAVVGIFPGFFELLGSNDLGSAGHNGFTEDEGKRYAVTFVRGGHGAALREENFDTMIRFALSGEVVDPGPPLLAEHRDSWVVWVSKLNWVIWLLLLALVGLGGYGVLTAFGPFWFLGYLALLVALLYTT